MSETILAYPAIRCRDVCRSYKLPKNKTRIAVDKLSLEVPAGIVFGFLGANGAGKTTMIKMLLGFLRPTTGRLEIFGEPCDEHTTRRHVGYLPEQPYFHPFLTPRQVLKTHTELLGLSRTQSINQIEYALEATRLQHNKDLPLSKLSKGNQQRVGIAQALLGSPRLLILDEPTSGLDPIARHEMREIIANLRTEGRTVFLSSHVLSEIDTLCDQVGVMNLGKLVACGSPAEIKQPQGAVQIVTTHLTPSAEAALAAIGVHIDKANQALIQASENHVFTVIRLLEDAGLPLISVTPNAETLETAFLRLAA